MNWLTTIINWLLPNACVLCGDASKRSLDLCIGCENDLPNLTDACHCCANHLSTENQGSANICGECLQEPPLFSQTIALFIYQKPVSKLIYQLKFNKNLVYARLLGKLLSKKISAHYETQTLPDIIVPVPLHFRRLSERGFNQAVEIARPLAKRLKIPIDLFNCERIRATDPQAELPADNRMQNVKDAFKATAKLEGKYVAVLDDVVTTGQTVSEVCHALQKAGVKKIDVWCCAKTKEKNRGGGKRTGSVN